MEMKKEIFVTFLLASLLSFSNAAPVGESDLSNGKEPTFDPFELDIDLDDVYKLAKVDSTIEKDFAKYDKANDILKDVVQELREEAVDIRTGDIEELNEDGDVKDSIEDTMRYLRSRYGNEDVVFKEEGNEQEDGDSELSNEEASDPVTKERDVKKVEDEEPEKDDSELSNREDVEPVTKENGIEKEYAEVKKEEKEDEISEAETSQNGENEDYFSSEYVSEYCSNVNGKIECLKKVCKWNTAEKRYICQTNEAETPSLFEDEKWGFHQF